MQACQSEGYIQTLLLQGFLKLTIAIGHTQEREQTITIYIMSVPSYMVKTQMIVFGNKGLIGLVQLFVLSSQSCFLVVNPETAPYTVSLTSYFVLV